MSKETKYTQIKVIGCEGRDTANYSQRFVKCKECPSKYNDGNCKKCRSANALIFVFE